MPPPKRSIRIEDRNPTSPPRLRWTKASDQKMRKAPIATARIPVISRSGSMVMAGSQACQTVSGRQGRPIEVINRPAGLILP